MAPNLLSGRTLPRLEKDIHVYQTPASPSSKEAWKRSVLCALRGAAVSATCSDAAHALPHSRVSISQPSASQQNAQGLCLILQWSALANKPLSLPLSGSNTTAGGRESRPHLARGGKHNSPHPGAYDQKNVTRKEEREGEEGRRTNQGAFFVSTKPGWGTQNLIGEVCCFFWFFFLINKNRNDQLGTE